jgi:hypothetical protein
MQSTKQNKELPPWVKASIRGTLYVDTSDERYNNFMLAQIAYLNQWKVKDGGLVKSNNSNLPEPNWKNFI